MRPLVLALIILADLILQTTIFPYIAFFGIMPNISLLIIVSYALLRGDVEGAMFGFCCGLLQDIFIGKVIGLYALLGMATGFVCGKPFRDFYRETYIIPFFMVAISCVAYEFAFYVLFFLLQGQVDIFYYLGRIILPEAVYTAFIALPIYRLLYGINKSLELHERYTRKLF